MAKDFTHGHTGGCLCGHVRYRTVRHTANAFICNCHFCQKLTGGPFLVEHCFFSGDVELTRGTPKVYTHVSAGSGKEVYLQFCGDCGSHVFMTFQRFPDSHNIFTTTLDEPAEVGYDPDGLQYLFRDCAQSGTVTPAGYEAFAGHCAPADGTDARSTVFDAPDLCTATDSGQGPHTGGCLCGAVRYEAEGDPEWVILCHCRSCQKSLGSGMNVELLYDPARFRVTQGAPKSHRHSGGSGKVLERRFCGDCGTAQWLTGERFPEVGLFRGTLDRPNRIALGPDNACQIYLDEALPSGMVLAGVEAFPHHVRNADDERNKGTFHARHWRIGDGPAA